MDSADLQARSIELAERAYRQKDRAQTADAKASLDDAADELIQINNLNRFYFAQSRLEKNYAWTEEIRALAHELNVADQTLRGSHAIAVNETVAILSSLAGTYITSNNQEVRQLGQDVLVALKRLTETTPTPDVVKSSIGFLIAALESILEHIENKRTGQPASIDPTTLSIRAMRDSLLSARELLIDTHELLVKDAQEGELVDRVQLARNSLAEIYKTMTPIDMTDAATMIKD